MIHLAAAVASIVWFVLTGLLWYAKPSAEIWLIGSVALAVIWGFGFFWYVTHSSKAQV